LLRRQNGKKTRRNVYPMLCFWWIHTRTCK